MSDTGNNAAILLEQIRRQAPEYFDRLLASTAEEFERAFDVILEQAVSHLGETVDNSLPLTQQGSTDDHPLKWSFLSTHAHSSGENVQVGHIGCNLYVE